MSRNIGPVLLARYRLAPQNPFPAALVDGLLSYLHLLYPPPGALHIAYTPEQVFLGGDSAGGGLALSLTQLLLWLNTPNDDGTKKTFQWRGVQREVKLPKALVLMSAWVDLARCFVEFIEDGRGGESERACAIGDISLSPSFSPEGCRC